MLETLAMSLRSLAANPLRTGLTVLGLMIGVAAFIAMVSFGSGARASVLGQFQKLGINVMSVTRAGFRPGGRPPSPLTQTDVEQLLAESDYIQMAVPVISHDTFLTANGRRHVTKMRATGPDFANITQWPMALGGMFDETDMKQAAKVCVLGQTPARALFQGADPIGQTVQVDGKMACRVIGVLAEKGAATSGRLLDDIVVTPGSTYFRRLLGQTPGYWNIDIRPQPGLTREAVANVVTDTLRHAHDLSDGEDNDFILRSNDDAIQVAGDVSAILTRLLAGIAAVSLLVGGIGIMNIQLVAVAERTQEIGVRAAIGASPKQILRQFLTEAVVLALIGTLLGALIGSGISMVVATAMKWPIGVPTEALLGAIIFGAGLGVFFGYLPARRAAELDPIEALRRE